MANDSTLTGGCQCGAVRFEISGTPAMAGHCHCTDCQKSSGAGHVTLALFPESAFRIEGRLSEYRSKADSGATVTRSFCSHCGGRLFGASTSMPGMLSVAAGSLDNPDAIEPQLSVYVKRRRHWDNLDSSHPAFEQMPPMAG